MAHAVHALDKAGQKAKLESAKKTVVIKPDKEKKKADKAKASDIIDK